jgi:hypothetical protein
LETTTATSLETTASRWRRRRDDDGVQRRRRARPLIAIAIVIPWLLLPCLVLPCIGRDWRLPCIGRDWRLVLMRLTWLTWCEGYAMCICEGYFGQSNDVEPKWLHQLQTNSKDSQSEIYLFISSKI